MPVQASKIFIKKQIKRSFLFDKNLSVEERQIIYTNLNSYNSNYSVSRFKNYCFISVIRVRFIQKLNCPAFF